MITLLVRDEPKNMGDLMQVAMLMEACSRGQLEKSLMRGKRTLAWRSIAVTCVSRDGVGSLGTMWT